MKLVIIFLVVLLIMPLVLAQQVFYFDNWHNKYKVYGSASCDVNGIKSCPNELSWEGNQIKFKYNLNSLTELGDELVFSFSVVYYTNYGKNRDANMAVTAGKNTTKFIVDGRRVYSVRFPKSELKIGKNSITLKGTNINVGYGKYPPTLVLGYVKLEG